MKNGGMVDGYPPTKFKALKFAGRLEYSIQYISNATESIRTKL